MNGAFFARLPSISNQIGKLWHVLNAASYAGAAFGDRSGALYDPCNYQSKIRLYRSA